MRNLKYFLLLQIMSFTLLVKAQIIIGAGQNMKLENGIYLDVRGNFKNNGVFNSDTLSFVKMSGGQQEISGTIATRFGNLIIDGNGNKILNSINPQYVEVSKNLIFNSQKIEINSNDLILLSNASIVNSSNQKYVITNDMGRLIKKNVPLSNDFLFPVGSSGNSYSPVTLNYTGLIDTFAVRVLNGVTPLNQACVQKTFLIKSSNPSTSLADITLAWNTVDHGSQFVLSQAYMWQQENGFLHYLPNPPGAIPNSPSTNWMYYADSIHFLSNITDSFIVKSALPPIITINPLSKMICENDSTSFSVAAAGLGIFTYQWQVNCSGSWSDINNGGIAPQYSGANDSILFLYNVPYSSNGCFYRCAVSSINNTSISNYAVLAVYPQPIAYILGDSIICEGESSHLTVLGNGNTYLWNTYETTQGITVYPLPPSQNYSVTVTGGNSCTSTAEIDVVTVTDLFVILSSNFEPDNKIVVGQEITFTATPPYYDNYAFLIGNDTVQSSASNIFSTSLLTENEIITVIASVNSCLTSDSLFVTVVKLPNAFTPFDKNGKNDIFASNVDLIILNRWGQVLYQGNDGWDGTYKGKNVSPGTYFYNITINKKSTKAFTVRGSVLVVSNNN